MKNKSGIIFILPLILIGVIIAGGAAVFANNYLFKNFHIPKLEEKFDVKESKEDTSNWKKFTDSQSGISFQYPANLYSISNSTRATYFWIEEKLPSPEPQYYFVFNELQKPIEEIVAEIQERESSPQLAQFRDDLKISQIKINGLDANKLVGTIGDGPMTGNLTQAVYFSLNNKTYFFSDTGFLKKPEIFDQILSTFEFTQ